MNGDPTLARTWGFDKSRLPLLAGLLAAVASVPAHGAAQAPDDTWRTLRTPHFQVTFASGLEEVARRAAARGEAAWEELETRFGPPPSAPVDLVVTDHADLSNGFASVFPSNRIVIFARPPVDGFGLQYFDDWLNLVVTHELVHVFHLDRTATVGRVLRTVFGRVPASWPIFPEAALPGWAIEGIATWFESELTGAGRVRGTYHDMVLRTAALEDAFESLDQALGTSPVWPLGDRAYVYGSRMFAHMADEAGDTSVARFVDAVRTQWVPYRLNSAAEDAFGRSFSEAWSEFREEVQGAVHSPRTTGTWEAVGEGGYLELHPRPLADGSVLHARTDGRSETQLRRWRPGEGGAHLLRTNGIAVASTDGAGGLVFHQREFVDPYRIRNDLYRWAPPGTVTRLTHGARLSHPSLFPDRTRAVAVQDGSRGPRLVTVDLAGGAVTPVPHGDGHYAFPAVSPDGRWIAASRWTQGGLYDVVLVDPATGGERVLSGQPDQAVDQSPTWSPDGRWVLFASDRTGISNLYAVAVGADDGAPGPLRQVSDVATGVIHPAVSPDGRWIYASVYHATGWRLERLPFDPATWVEPGAVDPRFLGVEGDAPLAVGPAAAGPATAGSDAPGVDAPVRPYSPWRSLRPRHWIPVFGVSESGFGRRLLGPWFGARSSGRDLVGRHSWAAQVEVGAEGGRVRGAVGWEYAGLGVPRIGVTLFQAHDAAALRGLDADSVLTDVFLFERERGVSLAARFDRVRVRTFTGLTLGASVLQETRELLDDQFQPSQDFALRDPDSPLVEGRATLGFSTLQRFAYSVSPESGVAASVTGRMRRELSLADSLRGLPGADDGFRDVRGSLRAYASFPVFGFANHVVAVRVAGGVAGGSGADAGHFDVGGAAGRPQSFGGVVSVGGRSLLFPVRGFGTDARFGNRAWSASAEYRVPLAVLHRGFGAIPLYFDRVWVSGFLDAGNAWGPVDATGRGVSNPRRSALVGAGGELNVTLQPFWSGVLHVRVGAGMPVRGEGGARAWVRLGTLF